MKFKPMSFDSTTPDVPASLCLAQGWQMIGHTSTQPVAWSTTLSSLRELLWIISSPTSSPILTMKVGGYYS